MSKPNDKDWRAKFIAVSQEKGKQRQRAEKAEQQRDSAQLAFSKLAQAHDEVLQQRDELLAACKASEELLRGQMDEAEAMDHALDAHDPDQCVLCQLREAIAKAEGRAE